MGAKAPQTKPDGPKPKPNPAPSPRAGWVGRYHDETRDPPTVIETPRVTIYDHRGDVVDTRPLIGFRGKEGARG